MEDLAAANTRAMMRRHELVASYWPVMSRLNQAEDAVAALISQVAFQGNMNGCCISGSGYGTLASSKDCI